MRIPSGIEYKGLSCFRDENDPSHYYFLSRKLMPETTVAGQPTFSLMLVGRQAILQLGTQWSSGNEVIEGLRNHLTTEMFVQNPVLSHIDVNNIRAELLLYRHGVGQILATSSTSRISPFTALFNTMLNTTDTASIQSAIHGNTGILIIRYIVDITLPIRYGMKISGSLSRLAKFMRENGEAIDKIDYDSIVAWLDYGVKNQILELIAENYTYFDSNVYQQDYKKVLEKSANLIINEDLQALMSDEPISLDIGIDNRKKMQGEYILSTDVADWFAKYENKGSFILGTGLSTDLPAGEVTSPSTLRIRFDKLHNIDIPVSHIELSFGNSCYIINTPFRELYTVDVQQLPSSITLEVFYKADTPHYRTSLTIVSGNEYLVTHHDIGLECVKVVANDLRNAGDQLAIVSLHYIPEKGDRTEQYKVERYTGNKWQSEWSLITGARALNGEIKYSVVEKKQDSSVVRHAEMCTTSTEIYL